MDPPPGVLVLAVPRVEPGRLGRLRVLMRDVAATAGGLLVLLRDRAPEEVLSACCQLGIVVRGSRVVLLPRG